VKELGSGFKFSSGTFLEGILKAFYWFQSSCIKEWGADEEHLCRASIPHNHFPQLLSSSHRPISAWLQKWVRSGKSRNQKRSVVGSECAYSSDFKNSRFKRTLSGSLLFLAFLSGSRAAVSSRKGTVRACVCHLRESLNVGVLECDSNSSVLAPTLEFNCKGISDIFRDSLHLKTLVSPWMVPCSAAARVRFPITAPSHYSPSKARSQIGPEQNSPVWIRSWHYPKLPKIRTNQRKSHQSLWKPGSDS